MVKCGRVARLQSPGTCRAWRDLLAPLSPPAHAESWQLGSIMYFFPAEWDVYVAALSGMFVRML